jgi:hypothetical protein
MIAFDNRDGLFPIHRSLRFLLLTCTTGRATTRVSCRFGERDLAVLDRIGDSVNTLGEPVDPWRQQRDQRRLAPHAPRTDEGMLSIAPTLLRRLSGESLTFPDVRTRDGLALLERLHATWPALTSADGWGVSFGRELNVTDDRALFAPAGSRRPLGPLRPSGHASSPAASGSAIWPVIEGKHLRPFSVAVEDVRLVVAPEHTDAVRARVPGLTRHRLAYRDVSCPTNRLTLIAAIVPPFVVTTHTIFCLRPRLDLEAQHCLCALMNSFVANYLVRVRINTHVTVAVLNHLPMPAPAAEARLQESEPFATLAALAAELAGRRRIDRAAASRLQALAAYAYGLSEGEFRHVLGTFPLIEEAEKKAAYQAFTRLPG